MEDEKKEEEKKEEVVEEVEEKVEISDEDWERNIRQKINENKDKSEWLKDVNAQDENKWSLKALLQKMTAVRDIAKGDRKRDMISMSILGAMYVIGILIILLDPKDKLIGYILVGAASAWKFFTWGDDVDKEIDKTSNSYTARTTVWGTVKVEKDQSYIGCIAAIIGLVLGIVITPILFVRSLLRFLKSDKSYKFAEEVVGDLENKLKVRYIWDNKNNKWNETVL